MQETTLLFIKVLPTLIVSVICLYVFTHLSSVIALLFPPYSANTLEITSGFIRVWKKRRKVFFSDFRMKLHQDFPRLTTTSQLGKQSYIALYWDAVYQAIRNNCHGGIRIIFYGRWIPASFLPFSFNEAT